MDDRRITPPRLKDIGKHRDQDDRNDRLDAELGTEYDGTDDKQGDVHADAGQGDLPSPQGVEHVGETIHAARSQVVRVHEHHIADSEKRRAKHQIGIGQNLLFQFLIFHILNT